MTNKEHPSARSQTEALSVAEGAPPQPPLPSAIRQPHVASGAACVPRLVEAAYEEAVARLHARPADRASWQAVDAARAVLTALGSQPQESAASVRARENFWKDLWVFYLPQHDD